MQKLIDEITAYVQEHYGRVIAISAPKLIDHSKYGFWFGGRYAPPEWNDSHTVELSYAPKDGSATSYNVLIGITSDDRVRLDGAPAFKVWMD